METIMQKIFRLQYWWLKQFKKRLILHILRDTREVGSADEDGVQKFVSFDSLIKKKIIYKNKYSTWMEQICNRNASLLGRTHTKK